MNSTNIDEYLLLGERIRNYRTSKKMSQQTLAEKARISLPHLGRIEHGQVKAQAVTIKHIAEALEIPVDLLFCADVPQANDIQKSQFDKLLADCSPEEILSIVKIAEEVKAALKKAKK